MLAIISAYIVHSDVPIVNDTFKHFNWNLVYDRGNNGFQTLNGSRFIHVDFGLNVTPKKKV